MVAAASMPLKTFAAMGMSARQTIPRIGSLGRGARTLHLKPAQGETSFRGSVKLPKHVVHREAQIHESVFR